ncbi:hypothetical protein DJ82_07270 [Halorubrum sp. Ib24]|nr:hypothetical protein DJ82_07270 [Halorubrum sp. Ib24]OYR44090.1 hypothetical protein DJ75_10530 [Halorubrum sp. Eb13]
MVGVLVVAGVVCFVKRENIRQKVSPSPATDGGDRSNGWLAQLSTFLFDKETGGFAHRILS